MRNVYTEYEKLDDEIKQAETDLNKLKERKKIFDTLSVPKRLAVKMHSVFCGSNHADGCGWYYDEQGWEKEYAHIEYLKRANLLVSHLGSELASSRNMPYLERLIDIIGGRTLTK